MAKQKYATQTGTLSYPHLHEPQEVINPDYQGYSCSLVFELGDTEKYQEIIDVVKSAVSSDSRLEGKSNIYLPYNVNEEDDTITFKFKRKTAYGAPLCVDKQKKHMDADEVRDRLYAGASVRIAYTPYSYSNQSHGVSLAFDAVQLVAEGSRILDSNPADVFSTLTSPDSVDDMF